MSLLGLCVPEALECILSSGGTHLQQGRHEIQDFCVKELS